MVITRLSPFTRVISIAASESANSATRQRATFGVVLFYRSAWYPHCNAQLGGFERAGQASAEAGVRVAALSVDERETTAALVAKHQLTFPVGYGADAAAIAACTGVRQPRAGVPAVHRLRHHFERVPDTTGAL